MTAHCTPTEEPIDGAYFYFRDGGYHLVIITKGKTHAFPMAKARCYSMLSSFLEAMKKEDTGSGFAGDT